MAYASDNHELIVANLVREIGILIKHTTYRMYPSNRMLCVPNSQLSYYPDAMVIKGEPTFYQYKKNMQGTLNPYAIFEVLSDTTEDNDRFDKWHCYQTIPTLQQYFMISQMKPAIDVYSRIENSNTWEYRAMQGLEQSIRVGEFDIQLSDIYWLVQFPEKVVPGTTDEAAD